MDSAHHHRLGPSLSLQDGALPFTTGECVFVPIPGRIEVDPEYDDEGTAVGTDLPPTSRGQSPQHLAFIRQKYHLQDGSYVLDVYPLVSFSRSGGAVRGFHQLTDAGKATLLPLPPLSSRHPSPNAFGAPLNPLDFGGWSDHRDAFLHVISRQLTMPRSRPFKRMEPPLIMPGWVLYRIDRYRETLRWSTQITNAHNRSGDEQGSSNPPGDGGGPAASGVSSVTTSTIADGEGEEVAEAGVEQFSAKYGLLVLEGVDEDAEGPDATMLDELTLLAHDDPVWKGELRRYLQEEEKQKKQIQKERAVRLAHWREDVAVQPC
ncbi:hypothetical protein F5887DRAFT_357480 [Amanita rubescens]|nr:hypothetical protein F5887DRAFT_357480 [Amanita rubescens]